MSPFVCLPGLMCHERLWRDAKFPATVVHADLTLDDSIVAMARRLLDQAPERFVAVGPSMGGIVALQLARLAPARIAGMILLDTNPAADTDDKCAMRVRQHEAVKQGALPQIVADELKPHYLAAVNRQDPDLLQLTLDMAIELGPDVFVRQSAALRTRPDAWPVLPTLTMPVLVACGSDDRLCPPDLHRDIAAACLNATLAIIEGAGHLTPLERPQSLNAHIARFAHDHLEGLVHG